MIEGEGDLPAVAGAAPRPGAARAAPRRRLSVRSVPLARHALVPGRGHALQPRLHALLHLLLADQPHARDADARRGARAASHEADAARRARVLLHRRRAVPESATCSRSSRRRSRRAGDGADQRPAPHARERAGGCASSPTPASTRSTSASRSTASTPRPTTRSAAPEPSTASCAGVRELGARRPRSGRHRHRGVRRASDGRGGPRRGSSR